jgi:hypothetical protein
MATLAQLMKFVLISVEILDLLDDVVGIDDRLLWVCRARRSRHGKNLVDIGKLYCIFRPASGVAVSSSVGKPTSFKTRSRRCRRLFE